MSIKAKFTGDTKELEREIDKLQRKYQQLTDQMEKVTKEGEKSGKNLPTMERFSSQAEQWAIGLASAAAGYVSIQQALQLVNSELQRQIELQKRAAGFSISVAASQNAVINNLGLSDKLTPEESARQSRRFIEQLSKVQKQAGFSSTSQFNISAASVLSASGDQDKTLEILAAAAPIFRHEPENLEKFAGGVSDVMKATGGSAEEAAALVLATFAGSRTTSLTAASPMAQTILSSRSMLKGVDSQQASQEIAGVFGALTRASGDAEGSPTRTSVVKFYQQLEKFGGEGSTLDRLAKVQERIASGDVKIDDFMKGFEAQSYGAVRDIITDRTSDSARSLVDSVTNTRGSLQGYQNLRYSIDNATPQLRAANSQARFDAAVEESYMTPDGQRLAARGRILELNERVQAELRNNFDGFQGFGGSFNLPFLGEVSLSKLSDATLSDEELVDSYIQGYRRRLSNLLGTDRQPDNEQERRDSELLRTMINELKGIKAELTKKGPNPIAQAAAQDERS